MTVESTVNDLLAAARRSAVHLEMRDGYMLDDPELRAWREGVRHDPDDRASWWNPFHDVVQAAVGRGVRLRRARIVSEPVSEYIRYEYDVTFPNVLLGEDVRWLPRRRAAGIPLPGNDFWLFDDETLLINHFSGEGDWIDTELVETPEVIDLCKRAFRAVWEIAVPHSEYVPV